MTQQRAHRLIIAILLLSHLPICQATETSDPSDANRYLDTICTFADNVLKLGRDTYGPKHTPLFVDGLNIHTHELVKWTATPLSPAKKGGKAEIVELLRKHGAEE
ncbi:MAG: hypothetical protein P8Z79_18265 [Sedimentisphaerales bacterium]|jgi:hypothetical protein